ncbi:MAG: hypothetical protein M1817_002038 [Caeruleum heppii]|nr:MAG: hypothetical protein M1817_002038 [Caeruleum heppii]
MGKRGKKFGGARGRGGRGGFRPRSRADFKEIIKENKLYEAYYNHLVHEGDPAEKDQFWDALKRDLPISFRFAGSKGRALAVQKLLQERYIPEIRAIGRHDDQEVVPPSAIPWYPDELAWSMTTSKNVIRRHQPFKSFQKFLVSETSVGNISRQEVVSMIPPLLMDIRPGMTVLDLCAAPGSKSAQLIEMVHAGEEARVGKHLRDLARRENREASPGGLEIQAELTDAEDVDLGPDDGRATGLLIANDVDFKRSHMLIHQMKRLNSPNLIVTNHDATMFPSIRLRPEPGSNGKPPTNQYLKFDRILADVPCSGDGTPRKNVNVWNTWNPGNALGLYPTQVRILVRALQMLKPGGRVVYSTCSMNPVENEAVVAAAIRRCGGSAKIQIVDCSQELPGLRRRPGFLSWAVMDKTGRWWSSWKQVEEHKAKAGPHGLERMVEGVFPPAGLADSDESISDILPLDRCMRVYAHHQDTGAFFITVLEKLGEIKARPESEEKKREPRPSTISTQPPAPSITAVAESIAAEPDEGRPLEKVDVLDKILPPTIDDFADASATARQNRENAPNTAAAGSKRELDVELEGVDEIMANKRVKVREEPEEVMAVGQEDRQVHWPPPPAADRGPASSEPPRPVMKPSGRSAEEPFKYMQPDHDDLTTIYDFYQLRPEFPRDRFMVRNASGTPVKIIYYTSQLAKEILTENEGKGIKFVHCGVKMFMKQDASKLGTCGWRIQSEGMPIVEGWIGEERIVRLYKQETLRKLLIEMFPRFTNDGWKKLGEIGERIRDMKMGCSVLRIEASAAADGFRERMTLPLWKSFHSLNLMLPKEDRQAMLLRLYNDETPLIPMTLQAGQGKIAGSRAEDRGLESHPEDGGGEKSETNGDTETNGLHVADDAVPEQPNEDAMELAPE